MRLLLAKDGFWVFSASFFLLGDDWCNRRSRTTIDHGWSGQLGDWCCATAVIHHEGRARIQWGERGMNQITGQLRVWGVVFQLRKIKPFNRMQSKWSCFLVYRCCRANRDITNSCFDIFFLATFDLVFRWIINSINKNLKEIFLASAVILNWFWLIVDEVLNEKFK